MTLAKFVSAAARPGVTTVFDHAFAAGPNLVNDGPAAREDPGIKRAVAAAPG